VSKRLALSRALIRDVPDDQIAAGEEFEEAGFDMNASDFADPQGTDILDHATRHPNQNVVRRRH
jgi:hypothetical protein